MPDFFAPDSVVRRVSREPSIMLGAGRALLLQLARPAVAQGVADHSDFRTNPFTRLQGTLEAMIAIVYGTDEVVEGVGRRVGFIHDHVVGPGYRANDVDHLLWVHATLVDTVLCTQRAFMTPLPLDDRQRYYQEMTRVAEVFGVPRQSQPADLGEFREYMTAEIDAVEVTATGRDLGRYILRPELPWRLHRPLGPALGLHRLCTAGLTPARLRPQFGIRWTPAAEQRFERARRAIKAGLTAVPAPIRTAPTRASTRLQVGLAARHNEAFARRRAAAGPAPSDRAAG